GNQLLALEAFARAVLLDHHVRDLVDPLVAGEPASAVEALAAAANDLALLALARVDDLIAQMAAERAFHLMLLAFPCPELRRGACPEQCRGAPAGPRPPGDRGRRRSSRRAP